MHTRLRKNIQSSSKKKNQKQITLLRNTFQFNETNLILYTVGFKNNDSKMYRNYIRK